ncbi:rho GTPase-activating protein 11A-like [Haliotis rubra]|uniref:rho GTPase-activating protein 11A-like n=1 Tax=Haliotis rubra TaxID=36100 RepID=UPI001EE5A16D|nr:rho GTPase-activating protein 11A-like [Haliotis rubra]
MDGYRHISCVERVNNLRTFIKDDLLNCGVKLPKNKKAKKLNNSRGPSQDGIHVPTGIFGNYLAHVPCEYVADCGYVPKFLVDSAEHIKMHFKTEGIFRKSGSVSRQKELKHQIEEGVNMDVSSIYDLTTLIKQFFRELPEPLFTSLYHDTFIKCYQLDDTKAASEAIHALCLLLPAEHLSTLRFIMQLLSFIASHSDDNKMDAANLAVVLAPNIMHVNSKSEKMNSTEEKLLQIQTAIVELLIKEAEKVGMVSSSLYQRTTLMTECFGVATDDELDASDDNTLEDSKDMKKKKKRKRSGSLQGIVSSIANGLAKLRRSTDGKNGNSSQNITTASNESAQSLSGSLEQPHYPTTTPVVIRKSKASGEVIPFSASKKKAILQHLPQGSALGHTPFTPASAIRKMDLNDPRKGGVMDTPSLSFGDKQHMAYTATPSHNIKTPRKKLNLFSPSSSKKKMARSPSFSNISTGSTKKSGRGKNIFRRLSGSKADKSSASDSSLHIGERLASPTKKDAAMDATSMRRSQSESDSPISARWPRIQPTCLISLLFRTWTSSRH